MKAAFVKALIFAGVPFLLAVLTDLLLWVFYQGADPSEFRSQIVMTHSVLFVAVLLLAGVGAFVAFYLLRTRVPSSRAVAIAGLLFAVATFFASFIAFAYGGPIALAAWLFVGSAVFAAGASHWGGKHAG